MEALCYGRALYPNGLWDCHRASLPAIETKAARRSACCGCPLGQMWAPRQTWLAILPSTLSLPKNIWNF